MAASRLTSTSFFTHQTIAAHLAAGHPMTVRRGEHWCCLLCQRQFKSERYLSRHLDCSTMHSTALTAAIASGRLPPSTAVTATEARAGIKRERTDAESDCGSSGGGGSSLSALEQMELFEKRLKSVTPRPSASTGTPHAEMAQVDSNHARSMNRQMDWLCSGCGKLNFARVVVCIDCKKHVDSTTKYVTNRLKEIKHQRFATAFQHDETLSRFAPAPSPQEARADGSFGDGQQRRASFHS